MFENRITPEFKSRRNLLKGGFPAAHHFLVDLEEHSAPVVWLTTAKHANVYWQEWFMMHVHFIDVGEVNTGIRITPVAVGGLVDGTADLGELCFPEHVHALVEQHNGFRNRWASRLDNGGVELRHPAPAPFFRELAALIERRGAEHRAEQVAAEAEAELAAEEAQREQAAEAPPEAPAPKTAAPRAAARREQTGRGAATTAAAAAAAVAASDASDEAPTTAMRPRPRRETQPDAAGKAAEARGRTTGRVRPLRPTDTQRFLTFDHLVDAYFEAAAHAADDDPRREETRARLERLEGLFMVRLPSAPPGRDVPANDRAQVVSLAWRSVAMANGIESPFLQPHGGGRDTMMSGLWDAHGEGLGSAIETVREVCRATFRSALASLFPGIEEMIVTDPDPHG